MIFPTFIFVLLQMLMSVSEESWQPIISSQSAMMQSQTRRTQRLRGQIQSQLCRTEPAAHISYAVLENSRFPMCALKKKSFKRTSVLSEVQDSLENAFNRKTANDILSEEYDINSKLLQKFKIKYKMKLNSNKKIKCTFRRYFQREIFVLCMQYCQRALIY